MIFTGERVVPFDSEQLKWISVMQHHISRYNFALEYVSGKTVYDLGCGTGYGSMILSFTAETVIGVDTNREAVEFAGLHFTSDTVTFERHDIESMTHPLSAEIFVCFEVLEHLENPELMMKKIAAKEFIVSLPLNSDTPFHKHIYTIEQAVELLTKYGAEIFYQDIHGNIGKEVEPLYVIGVKTKPL